VQLGNHHKGTKIRRNLPKVSVLREVLLKENAISTSLKGRNLREGYAVVIAQVAIIPSLQG